jgi:Protein of unknown function (DUF3396)
MILSNTFSKDDLKAAEAMLKLVEALVIKNGEGRVIGRCVWKINLVFHNGHLRNVRERAWKVLEHFVSVCPRAELVWVGKGKPKKFDSAAAQKEMTKIQSVDFDNPNESIMPHLGVLPHEPSELFMRNAQPYFLKMDLSEERQAVPAWPGMGAGMSVLQLGLPLEWNFSQPDGKRVVWFTQKAVEILQPYWCTAGWGVSLPPDCVISPTGGDEAVGEQQVLYPYVKRFPGMEALPYLRLNWPHFNSSMYSVNWLNFLSDPLLDKLGGRETAIALAAKEPLLRTQDVGNCLMIAAGPGPGLGDTDRGVPLPGYGAAARLLKRIRVQELKNPCVAPPPYGSGDEKQWMLASDAYLSRFDLY